MSDPYATHLPVLRALCETIKPKRVLEFGGGNYSTPFFLALPTQLVTIERDLAWRVRLIEEYDHEATLSADPADFDLVLIDDGKCAADRVETIRSVLSGEYPPVVIHDAEVPAYREAYRELAGGRTLVFCLDTPHTALVWPEGWAVDRYKLAGEVSRCAS